MEIIVGEITAVDELVDRSRIRSIAHQEIDVTRIGLDICLAIYRNWTSSGIKDLNARQTKIIAVAPCLENIEFQESARRKVRDHKRLTKDAQFLSKYLLLSFLCMDLLWSWTFYLLELFILLQFDFKGIIKSS